MPNEPKVSVVPGQEALPENTGLRPLSIVPGIREQAAGMLGETRKSYPNPDQNALNLGTAKALDVTPQHIEGIEQDARSLAQFQQDLKDLEQHPVTQRFLSDMNNAKLAHDDVRSLTLVERAAMEQLAPEEVIAADKLYYQQNPFFTRLKNRFKGGVYNTAQSFEGIGAVKNADVVSALDAIDSGKDIWEAVPNSRRMGATGRAVDPVWRVALEYYRGDGDTREKVRKQYEQNFRQNIISAASYSNRSAVLPRLPSAMQMLQAKDWEGWWSNFSRDPIGVLGQLGVESGPQSLVVAGGALVGGVTAGVPGAIVGSGTTSTVLNYGSSLVSKLQEFGADLNDPDSVRRVLLEHEREIKNYAIGQGIAIGLFDAAAVGLPMTRLVPLKGFVGGASEVMAQMSGQALLGAGGQATADYITTGRADWYSALNEGVGELFTGPLDITVASIIGARSHARNKAAVNRLLNLEAAIHQRNFTDKLNEIATSSPMHQRAPEKFGEHMGQVLRDQGIQDIFISARSLKDFVDEDPATRGNLYSRLGIQEQMTEALALGGDVKVSAEAFGQHVIGTENYEGLADHVRLFEEGMSPSEAKAYDKSGIAQEAAAIQARQAEAQAEEQDKPDTNPLPNIPKDSPGPVPGIIEAAHSYAQESGTQYRRQGKFVKADPIRGARIAEAYDSMEHNPNDPEVKVAYEALVQETLAQYQKVKELGINIEVAPVGHDPYPGGPKEVLEDLRNGHLWLFPTDQGFGANISEFPDNPLLAATGEKIGDHVLLANDIFRIVHDVFGHGKEGVGFGPSGEENAWQAHVRMYSPLAARAMTTETRGQNSWVNFGPHGAANRANQRETTYAPQKTGLLPAWVMTDGLSVDWATGPNEATTLAEAELGMNQFFFSAKDAGLTENAYQSYLRALKAAADNARARSQAGRLKRREKMLTERYKRELETVMQEVEQSLLQQPVYAAIAAIGRDRLNQEQVREAVDELGSTLDALPLSNGRRIYAPASETGVDLDAYAQINGYADGTHMILDMLTAEDLEHAVYIQADRVMQERHGEILDERRAVLAAKEALHNEDQAKVFEIELNSLRKQAGQKRTSRKLIRRAAREAMGQHKVGDIQPSRYENNAAKYGRQAAVILRTGDVRRAAELKFLQLMNFYMAKEAYAVREKVGKNVVYLRRFNNPRKKWKGLPVDSLDTIRSILGKYGLVARMTEQRRKNLTEWAQKKARETGDPVRIPKAILDADRQINYRDMTLQEFGMLANTIREVEHKGRMEDKFRSEAVAKSVGEAVSEVTAAMADNLKPRDTQDVNFIVDAIRSYGSVAIANADTILRRMDGWKNLGPAYKYIKGTYDKAMSYGYREGQVGFAKREQQEAKKLVELFDQHFTKKQLLDLHKKVYVPALGRKVYRKQLLATLLNMGNQDNIDAMIESRQWTQEQLHAIREFMSDTEHDFVQATWDYLGSFFDEIAETHKRRTNRKVERVDALPFEVRGKQYAGGYYPLRYDRFESVARPGLDQEELLQHLRGGQFIAGHTKDGHTMERVGADGTPVLLDPYVIHNHVNQVIYDLEVGDAVIDTYKMLSHKELKAAFRNMGYQQDFQALELWFGDIVTGEIMAGNRVEKTLRYLRSGFTISKIGWNFGVVLMQGLGVFQASVQIGKANMVNGIMTVLRNPTVGERSIFQYVADQSTFMETRQNTFHKDITDARVMLRDHLLDRVTPGRTATFIRDTMFFAIKKAQYVVDVAVWLGAREAGLQLFNGDVKQANFYADRMVARSQASGIFGDRTALERGTLHPKLRQTELVRSFTPLMSYFLAKNNVAIERISKVKNWKNPIEAASLAIDMVMLYSVESVLTSMLYGMWPGPDDPDDDAVAKAFVKETAKTVFSGMPFLNGAVAVMSGYTPGGVIPAVMSQVGTTGVQIGQGEIDAALVRNMNNLLGIFLHYPSAQINKTQRAVEAANNGEDVSGWDYLLGPPHK